VGQLDISGRLDRLRRQFYNHHLEALLVAKPENRFYLSGFTGSAGWLLITMDKAWLVTDFRYAEQASSECVCYNVVQARNKLSEKLAEIAVQAGIKNLGFERGFWSVESHQELVDNLGEIKLVPVSGLVEHLRMVKDSHEVGLISDAAALADEAFAHIINILRPGLKEIEIAAELEYFLRRNGATGRAFETIVASGTRSSLPHGVASEKVLAPGDLVVLDFGAVYKGYHSDITRTVVIGEVDNQKRQLYRLVLEAQTAALEAIQPGMVCSEVDKIARDIIDGGGYGDRFGHGLGHGVGLCIHELPRLAMSDSTPLQPGMVVTVEPGVYLPGWGGIRIEDLVVVTAQGVQVLTTATKELLIV